MIVEEIITGASLSRKPTVNGQNHLTGLRLIGQSGVLIREPHHLVLAVTLANVHAQLDKGGIRLVRHRPRVSSYGVGNLDSDRSLVIGSGRGTPRAVRFVHIQADTTIRANTIVTGNLSPLRSLRQLLK